ncbi:hypothetical protein CHUAL_012535 [Chamberlinius hualienensis]
MGESSRCSGRCFVIVIIVLQLIAAWERQIFDFLGYLWLSIAINFLYIICIILGLFGVYQYRAKYIIVYIVGSWIWVGWNVFIICFYLEVGSLSRDDAVLNLTTGSRSWFEANAIGCLAKYNESFTGEQVLKPVSVKGCLVPYYYIECAHSLLQIFLTIIGAVGAGFIAATALKKDEDLLSNRRSGSIVPYSIEFQRHPSQENAYQQKPMTPRKVKRRSTRSRRGPGGSYRQSYYQNPVTKLMERSVDSSTSNDSYCPYPLPPYRPNGLRGGQVNLGFQNPQPQQTRNFNANDDEDDGFPPPPPLPMHNPPYMLNQGELNMGFENNPLSRPIYAPNGRPSPIYMNDSETVI